MDAKQWPEALPGIVNNDLSPSILFTGYEIPILFNIFSPTVSAITRV